MRIGLKWRYGALVVGLVIIVWGLWLVYASAHWMAQVSWATVTVDERPVVADAYIGNPTENEAEAFLLIHVPELGDYLLNFDGENYREASSNEFARFYRHAWTFRSMDGGHFIRPLPPQTNNQFRFLSHGHIMNEQ